MLKYFLPILLLFLFACNFTQHNADYAEKAKQHNAKVVASEMMISTALSFINDYVKNCNKMKEAVAAVDWVNKSDKVTQEFKTALKKLMDDAYVNDSESGLDADPIFNAQDYPDKGFDLEKIDYSAKMVHLKGIEWPDFKLKIRMTKQNNKWLVDGCGMVNL